MCGMYICTFQVSGNKNVRYKAFRSLQVWSTRACTFIALKNLNLSRNVCRVGTVKVLCTPNQTGILVQAHFCNTSTALTNRPLPASVLHEIQLSWKRFINPGSRDIGVEQLQSGIYLYQHKTTDDWVLTQERGRKLPITPKVWLRTKDGSTYHNYWHMNMRTHTYTQACEPHLQPAPTCLHDLIFSDLSLAPLLKNPMGYPELFIEQLLSIC